MSHNLRETLRIVNPQKSRYFRGKILEWHKSNKRSFPWRKTKNSYYILVAEILLQQTDAAKVAKEYSSFIKTFPKPRKLATASKSSVSRFIGKLGLDYRVNRLISVARELEKKFKGTVPNTKEELLKLPGIGPYMANATLASAYHKRVAVLDTNIVRILERFFGLRSSKARGRTDPVLWTAAQRLLPKKTNMCKTWNYAMLDFGALVCSHYSPRCKECPCKQKCNYLSYHR
jgi:A/G-specific adenine glycosylase